MTDSKRADAMRSVFEMTRDMKMPSAEEKSRPHITEVMASKDIKPAGPLDSETTTAAKMSEQKEQCNKESSIRPQAKHASPGGKKEQELQTLFAHFGAAPQKSRRSQNLKSQDPIFNGRHRSILEQLMALHE